MLNLLEVTMLHDYKAYSKNYMVKIADGSLSKVVGTGTVYISPCFKLHSVLLVPSLKCNLLSMSKLTKYLNSVANFSTGYCKFQDFESGKTIGNAKECEGLYFLEVSHPRGQAQTASSVISHVSLSNSNKESAILLWHYRLGHPNFLYLKILFPSLFRNVNLQALQCEICQLSKQCRNNYPIQGYKPSKPFTIIHRIIVIYGVPKSQ